ncbi:hypothetical protein F5B21DRAFT_453644 [Xylaria acuta]|nr:hypothetical protein F5B21DRAFT_453644 [Xylaria acuta]
MTETGTIMREYHNHQIDRSRVSLTTILLPTYLLALFLPLISALHNLPKYCPFDSNRDHIQTIASILLLYSFPPFPFPSFVYPTG